MKNKKNWLGTLVIMLVCGMSVLVIGCGQKGGTITFINDYENTLYTRITCDVGIAVSASGTPNAPVLRSVYPGQQISESLDEDGYYIVAGTYSTTSSGGIGGDRTRIETLPTKTGRVTGGETITVKFSERYDW